MDDIEAEDRSWAIDVIACDAVWFAEGGPLARLVRELDREALELAEIGGEG